MGLCRSASPSSPPPAAALRQPRRRAAPSGGSRAVTRSARAAAVAAPAPSAAALTGTLTVWEAYGASGTAEKDAFDKMVANVMAANPGLTVTVTDVPFANLFTNFETQAGAGSGPDLYIAPNDNLPKEARAGLLKDVSSLIADPHGGAVQHLRRSRSTPARSTGSSTRSRSR